MIQLFKTNENTDVYKCQLGDKIRMPILGDMFAGKQEYNFKFVKLPEKSCVESLDTEIEVNNGRLIPFKCSTKGTFKIRVKSYDEEGETQFSVNVDNKPIGKVFKGIASTMSDYIDKILRNFNNSKSWSATSNGNIIEFKQKDDCDQCGQSVNLSIGKYNKVNQNSPNIISQFIATESVVGSICYLLSFDNFKKGNRYTIDGLTVEVSDTDTEKTLRTKFQGDSEYYCIPSSTTIEYSATAGTQSITNTNSPTIRLSYAETDSTYDYYVVKVYDVRQGNIFDINGTRKIVSSSDTQSTINAFFNAYSGRFRITKGTSINAVALSGTILMPNLNTPEISVTVVSPDETRDKDKYNISIAPDVVKGNTYTLGTNYYVAKDGDTSIDVAYGLYGANDYNFFYYAEEGETLDCYATQGFKRDYTNISDVDLISSFVECCEKQSIIFDFEALETGLYQCSISDTSGNELFRSTRIEVLPKVEGELVFFSNTTDAYGIEFDKNDIFSLRLPIFLQDTIPFINEELNENLNGDIVRGKTTIQERRNFVTKSLNSEQHGFLIKVLKCDFVGINGISYQFEGEYSLPQHREGALDIRSATGLLIKNGKINSNL